MLAFYFKLLYYFSNLKNYLFVFNVLESFVVVVPQLSLVIVVIQGLFALTCGRVFRRPESNPYPLHWQDFTTDHQGSPSNYSVLTNLIPKTKPILKSFLSFPVTHCKVNTIHIVELKSIKYSFIPRLPFKSSLKRPRNNIHLNSHLICNELII